MSRKRLGHVFKEEDEAVDPWSPAKIKSDEDKEESEALENIESFPVDWTSFATSSIRESIDQDINSSFDTLRAEDSSALTNDLGKDKTMKFMLKWVGSPLQMLKKFFSYLDSVALVYNRISLIRFN